MSSPFRSFCIAGVILLIVSSHVNADPVEVRDIDTYRKVISSGEETMFNWTLRNLDVTNKTLLIIATAVRPENWMVNLTPERIELRRYDAQTFTLEVRAPSGASGRKNITVMFYVYQDSALIMRISKYVIVSIHEGPTEGEKSRVFGWFENPLPPPLDNDYGVFLLDVLVWLVISLFVVFIMNPLLRHLIRKTKTRIDDIVLEIVRTPIIVLVVLYGAVSSLSVLDWLLGSETVELLERIYMIGLVLSLFYIAYKLFRGIIIYYGREISKKTATKIDDVLVPLIEKVGIVVIGLIALAYVLRYAGVDLTLFVAGGVVVSMVIAFAAQETLSNFFSGIFILTDRPFHEGDQIILSDGEKYEVRYIGLRSTRLYRFSDASLVSVPNNKLANEMIANFTNPYDKGKITKTIGVAYGTDPVMVRKIIREIVDANPHIIKEDSDLKPIVRFEEMGDSAIIFKIIVWITDRRYLFEVNDYLNTEIYRRFSEEGIEIPYPQRVVHLKEEGSHGK